MRVKIKITSAENASYYGVPVNTEVDEELEMYVAAVVASEIGNAPLEACKAQAVASRTFVYRYILKNKAIPDGPSAQVYRAKRYSDAYKICRQAAEATRGQFLSYKNAPADTYFCHSNGGRIISSQEKWGGVREYLVSKPDPWDTATHSNRSGHGVGMSQTGAKYAADHGISYKEILDFYYTGTTLSTIQEKEECLSMITLDRFLNGTKRNASRIHGYKLGCNGSNGLSDCIGYIIGSLELEGQKWGGTHGSNYAARYRTKNLHKVSNASQLKLGELVYKVKTKGQSGYDLPDKYKTGSDLNDYYHVGVVTSVNPLTISHCSGGGMHYDEKIGNWKYAGYCSLVDYSAQDSAAPVNHEPNTPVAPATGKMVVDVPDDTSVNVRRQPSTSAGVLTRLPEGNFVNVTSVSGAWSHVNYSYAKTGEGYVMSKFINNGVVDVPNDTSVNVRRQPSTSAARITTLPEGTAVSVLSKTGAWCKVEYSFMQEGTGYVMSKYLRKG